MRRIRKHKLSGFGMNKLAKVQDLLDEGRTEEAKDFFCELSPQIEGIPSRIGISSGVR